MIDRRGLGLAMAAAAIVTGAHAETPAATTMEQDPGAIVVTAQRRANEGTAGTKTPSPIAGTPQSISVIDAETIADLGLQNLNQALRFVAGVTPETRGGSAEVYDQFKLRGFDAPVFLDGLRLFGGAGYAAPQVDVSRLDRIEIVKGAASALYGQSGPGGLVVQSSKLPLDRAFYGAVSGTYGTYDLYRVDADVGGQASDTLLWRAYGSVNGAHAQQRYGRRDRQTISGAVTWKLAPSTSLTVLGAYSRDPKNGNYGVFPALGTLIPNPAGKIATDFYGGEPGDFFKREQVAGTYILKHDFGDNWAFKASGRYQRITSRLGIVYTGGTQSDFYTAAPSLAPRSFSRFSYSTVESVDSWTYDNQLTGRLDTGPLRHDLLFGVDRQVSHGDERYAFGGATAIDVFNPVYGTMPTPQSPEQVIGYSGTGFSGAQFQQIRQRQQGLYAQDQISLGGLRVLLSGRQDWARQVSASPGSPDTTKKDSKFTYRVGALYTLPMGLAPYVSLSTSFQPQPSRLASGGLASPSLGKQVEAGLKYQIPGTDILLTGAWFDIRQSNVLVSDPLTFAASQTGRVRSRGIEFEATAPLPGGFNARIAYSRQRVKVIDDVDPARIGRSLATVGRGGISANLEWEPKGGPAQGLAIGGAVRHVDRTYADVYTDPLTKVGRALYTPSYTVFDALARYDLGKVSPTLSGVKLGLTVTNLFDKKYLTSCYANYAWCWYGNRRTVQGTIGYRF